MELATAIMYHPSQLEKVRIISKHYEQVGDVRIHPFDFLKQEEHFCRNQFYGNLSDYDYILTMDFDEIILLEDLRELIRLMKDGEYDCFRCNIIDYVSPGVILSPSRSHVPVIAVRPEIIFTDKRCIAKPGKIVTVPIEMHHLWYLGEPDWKIEQYKKRGVSETRIVSEMLSAPSKMVVPPEEVLLIQERFKNAKT